ncbi:matrixin family metalloprotease [Secundilactobacillus odoratitofui]|nr:matrixin family metalloprotease [Secundilactobacillus odoratitofui]
MRRWMILLTTVLAVTAVAGPTTAAAKSKRTPTPTKRVLAHTASYYQLHEDELMATYGIDQGYQTAFDNHTKIWVYDQTRTKGLTKSIKVAMRDWNSQLGQTVFVTGTKKHHTLTIKLTSASSAGDGEQIAWWRPTSQSVEVSQPFFNHEWLDINKYMKLNYARQNGNQIDLVKSSIDDTTTDVARQVEYSRILAHEFGHSLGLSHSKNPADLMYAGIGFSDIYHYDDVTSANIWANPLSKTDISRGKLAVILAD